MTHRLPSLFGPRPLVLTVTLAGVGGCAPEVPEHEWVLAERAQTISGGRTDAEHKFVVGLYNTSAGGMCTGSLIAPNLVLTAQHCVAEVPTAFVLCGTTTFGDVYDAEDFVVSTATQLGPGADFMRVDAIEVPPGSRGLCGSDIALMFLSESVPGSVTSPVTPRIDLTAEAGERYSAHGYGDDGTGSWSAAGTRRWITARSVYCDGPECASVARGQILENEWAGSEGTCQGDSGGPAVDEEGRVFGVLSRGGDGCSSSVYSSVDDWSEWIRDAAQRAAELGGYAPAPWVTTGSSDATIVDDDADGVDDAHDNCLVVANPDQDDLDVDGRGDFCDPIDDRLRGGSCSVCDGCAIDGDCSSAGDTCVNFGAGGVCTRPCVDASSCPATTACFAVPDGASTRSLCLNDDAPTAGVCADGWVCGGAVVADPAMACDVCEPCVSDAQCLHGRCVDFGSGGVCTRSCADGTCPGDAACWTVQDQQLCLNPSAAAEGVCPSTYICRAPEPAATGDDGGEAPETETPGLSVASTSSGCAVHGRPRSLGACVFVLGWLIAARRRRDAAR